MLKIIDARSAGCIPVGPPPFAAITVGNEVGFFVSVGSSVGLKVGENVRFVVVGWFVGVLV
jgi:hypothetical protein